MKRGMEGLKNGNTDCSQILHGWGKGQTGAGCKASEWHGQLSRRTMKRQYLQDISSLL